MNHEFTFDYAFDGENDDWEVTIGMCPAEEGICDAYAELVSIKPPLTFHLPEGDLESLLEYGFDKCNDNIENGKDCNGKARS